MQQITINEGQTLRITGPNVTIEVIGAKPKGRRGPRSLPKATVSSIDLHDPILRLLGAGKAVSSKSIRDDLLSQFPGATTNTVSWALVELQNEDQKRGKNRRQTGPVVKTIEGLYSLR
jgi:hypothetical protein